MFEINGSRLFLIVAAGLLFLITLPAFALAVGPNPEKPSGEWMDRHGK